MARENRLSPENQAKLKERLTRLSKTHEWWTQDEKSEAFRHAEDIAVDYAKETEESYYEQDYYTKKVPEKMSPEMTALKRTVKAKKFFKQQSELPEEKIRIPKWYHATRVFTNMESICNQKTINVRHASTYAGAWTSTQPERGYGQNVVCLSSEIENGRSAKIHIVFTDRRWRGWQQEITLNHQTVCCLAVQCQSEKTEQSRQKGLLKQRVGLKDISVFSDAQVAFMAEEICKCLGVPDLSNALWGR